MPTRSLSTSVVTAIALVCAACSAAPTSDGLDSSQDRIQGGEPEMGEPAVGMITDGGGFCTATLIAPDIVLTGAHCLGHPIAAFMTTDGTSTTPTVRHPVKAQASYPQFAPISCPSTILDVGLVKLKEPITDITPKKFGVAPVMGATCRAVGFGRYGFGAQMEHGKKRSATETIEEVADKNLTVAAGTGIADSGDSGGPLLCDDVVVGTVSCHADGGGTGHTHEYYARVQQGADWIARQIEAWSNPSR